MLEVNAEIRKLLYELESSNHWKPMVANELLFSEKYNLLYASCSKNACSKIKSILGGLNSYPNPFVGDPHKRQDTHLLGPYQISENRLNDALFGKNTLRFAFVRNPFERVISCFKNRVDTAGLEKYDDKSAAMRALISRRRSIISWKTGRNVAEVDPFEKITFDEFIEFICQQDAFEMDRHWYFQSRSIHFETIKFDKIGRVENFANDMKQILEAAGIPKDIPIDYGKLNSSDGGIDASSYFDPSLERLFVNKFEEDFINFDYVPSVPGRTHIGFERTDISGARDSTGRSKSSTLKEDVSVIIPAMLRLESLRECIKSIRLHLGPDIEVQVGWQGRASKYLREFCHSHGVFLHVLADDLGLSATRNFLVKQTKKEFVLLCDDDFVFTRYSNIQGGLALLDEHPNVKIVGGLLDDVQIKHNGLVQKRKWINYANYIHFDRKTGFLAFIPIEYVPHDRLKWRHGYFTYCNTVLNFALIRRSLFIEQNIWWDDQIKITGEHEDFYLKIFESQNIDVVFYSGMQVEHRQTRPFLYKDLRSRNEWKIYWMKKWGVKHFLCFGKWHDYYDHVSQKAWRVPFRYRNALGNSLDVENFSDIYGKNRRISQFYSGPSQLNETNFKVNKSDYWKSYDSACKLFHQEKFEDALRSFKHALIGLYDNANLLRCYAEVQMKLGNYPDALESLLRAKQLLPNNKNLELRIRYAKGGVRRIFAKNSPFNIPRSVG